MYVYEKCLDNSMDGKQDQTEVDPSLTDFHLSFQPDNQCKRDMQDAKVIVQQYVFKDRRTT
jgi:hypothetical protein